LVIKCPACKSKATINGRNVFSENVSDVYCTCSLPQCGCKFVMSISLKKINQQPTQSVEEIFADLWRKMTEQERADLKAKVLASDSR
jgi:hypothetical protein